MLFGKTTSASRVSPTRYQIFRGVGKRDLKTIALDNNVNTLQFSEPLSNSDIQNLESIVFSTRSDITLRVFGFYNLTCDLRFLENIPSLRNISADCLTRAVSVDVLANFRDLEKLSIGIFNLESFDFLNRLPPTLKELSLSETSSKKPSIDAIQQFHNLKFLYLDGQQKGIEAVNKLPKLERIVLRSISTKDTNYLEGLENLWSVDIELGGIKSFDSLTKLKNLKYLELWQILGLSELSFITDISSLQYLFIQSLRHVTTLPRFDRSYNLRRLYLENLKGLIDLSSLEFAPALEEFVYVLAQNQQPERLLPLLRNRKVKAVSCGFGSNKKQISFEKLASEHGKRRFSYTDFKFA